MEEAFLSSWALEFGPLVGLVASALVYLRGWLRLRRQVPARFEAWRCACFLGGLTTLYVAVASPLDAFASFLLSAHMVQHLLLTMVAPPLLLLGNPFLPVLTGLPKAFVRDFLGPFLTSPTLRAVAHRVMHPAVGWTAFVLSNILWHIPALYDLALRSPTWHQVEHFSFLGTALLFWFPVIQPFPSRPRWPRWAMIPYLLLADLQNTALAAFLSFYDRVIYQTYADAPRIASIDALADQAAAGGIMWVPGSVAFLAPAALIASEFLSPKRGVRPSEYRQPAKRPQARPASPAPSPLDLLRVPLLGTVLVRGRKSIQIVMLALAAIIVIDGFRGTEVSALNLAGVLPWTHWRAFTVIGLLAVGNLFCMACPFTFVRDLGRKFLPANRPWPRVLRSKWLAVGLIVVYLWAYEAFDLWDNPAATAGIILGYFLAALLIDGFFKRASFCKYVCPIGQFHFVQSLVSPFQIQARSPDACASCRTHDCIRGNTTQRGCELDLFVPRKSGNMDCTLCLDCVKACPHDNIGLVVRSPVADLTEDRSRSSIGRYAKRTDLAALVLVLTFGAFANAAGMVTPVLDLLAAVPAHLEFSVLAGLAVVALVFAPAVLALAAAWLSHRATDVPLRENLARFAIALAPLGFGMWVAHFVFHLVTAATTPLPAAARFLADLGFALSIPAAPMITFYDLPAVELFFLDIGYLAALFLMWRIARPFPRPASVFLPWAALATGLFLAGVWIIFQPMEMRGTLLH